MTYVNAGWHEKAVSTKILAINIGETGGYKGGILRKLET